MESCFDDEVGNSEDFNQANETECTMLKEKIMQDFNFVSDGERSLVVDAFALLGGNEYLVQQMIDKLVDTNYSPAEEASIRLATDNLWENKLDVESPLNLGHLLEFLTPLHQERLPRILATSLLYCGRYEDTQVAVSSKDPSCRMLLVSLSNFPGSDPPAGHTPSGQPCPRLAILYHWASPQVGAKGPNQEQTRTRNNSRKISASLALERKMLSIVDVFAIFPCP
eukprot:GFUD01011760.1.p1 GENE.GFUD01011760.1~~GFUD01011760.1.p1  ORF type:complete len:225 (+),score=42.79 GFUD01011760.1:174-848(+)